MNSQELRALQEAYSQVYAPQELEEEPKGLPYGPVGKGFKKLPAGPKREKMMKNAKKYTRAAMADADREGEAVGDNRNKMGRINSALTNPRLREGVDLFDYILEHLVAEGYADTNEAALAIMANMSEEWRESIVEEVLDEASVTDDRVRRNQRAFGSNYTPPRDWDQSANRGKGAVLNAKQKEKQRRKGLARSAEQN